MAQPGNIRITIDEDAAEALRSLGSYRRERIATELMAALTVGTDLESRGPNWANDNLALDFVMRRTDALIARLDKTGIRQ